MLLGTTCDSVWWCGTAGRTKLGHWVLSPTLPLTSLRAGTSHLVFSSMEKGIGLGDSKSCLLSVQFHGSCTARKRTVVHVNKNLQEANKSDIWVNRKVKFDFQKINYGRRTHLGVLPYYIDFLWDDLYGQWLDHVRMCTVDLVSPRSISFTFYLFWDKFFVVFLCKVKLGQLNAPKLHWNLFSKDSHGSM